MRFKFVKSFLVFAVLLMMAPATVFGQDACSAYIQQALNTLGTNCANQDLNTICYGYNGVNAEFVDTANVTFAQPADRAGLGPLQAVSTQALDTTNDVWGIAVMRVQANLPQSLPGQSAVIMMLGEADVENNVLETDALVADAVLPVTVAQTTDLLRFPPDFGNEVSRVVGVAATGEVYQADGITEDGAYVRVFYEFQEVGQDSRRATAWISVDSLDAVDTSSLDIITADSLSPMQAFTVRTGLGQPECEEAPSQLFVQGPDNIETEIIINEVEVTVASTAIVRTTARNGQAGFIIFAVQGDIDLVDEEGDTAQVPAGSALFVPFDEDDDGDLAGAILTALTPEEAASLAVVEQLPGNLLNYVPVVPQGDGGGSGIGR